MFAGVYTVIEPVAVFANDDGWGFNRSFSRCLRIHCSALGPLGVCATSSAAQSAESLFVFGTGGFPVHVVAELEFRVHRGRRLIGLKVVSILTAGQVVTRAFALNGVGIAQLDGATYRVNKSECGAVGQRAYYVGRAVEQLDAAIGR